MPEVIVCPKIVGNKDWLVYHHAGVNPIGSSREASAPQKDSPYVVVGKGQLAFLAAKGAILARLVPGTYPLSPMAIPQLGAERLTGASVDIYFVNGDARLSMYFGTSSRPISIVDPVCGEKYRLQVFGRFSLSCDTGDTVSASRLERLANFESVFTLCRGLIDRKLAEYVQNAVNEYSMDVSVFSSALLSPYIQQAFSRDLSLLGLSLETFLLDTIWINDEDMVRCLNALHVHFGTDSPALATESPTAEEDSPQFCFQCGRKLPPDARFCPFCGQSCLIQSCS